jgi:hypothetical protein
VQTQGSLQESSLASLLQTMQVERATGALSLESESDSASLYFLFGHLFHAQSPSGQGEDVVLNALAWQDGRYRFDPRAKLPPEETIKSSPGELIAEAERRTPSQPESEEVPSWDGQPAYAAPGGEAGDGGQYAEPPWEPGTEEPSPAVAAPVPGPGEAYPGWSGASPAYEEPGPYDEASQPAPTAYTESGPHAPPPGAPQEMPMQLLGAPSAPPLEIIYPLPAGRPQYEGLKSAFVDFPKLLRTLRADQHTGYVRLTSSESSSVLLFHDGELLEALSSEPGAASGDNAFQAMRRSMDAGAGLLDVIDLSGDTVEALSQLLTAPLLYTGLLGRFINFEALLAHLTEENVEGAVMVVGSEDVGIILLSQGQVLGAYTQASPTLSSATTGVAKIAAENTARIEVKNGAGRVAPIDVERALSRTF